MSIDASTAARLHMTPPRADGGVLLEEMTMMKLALSVIGLCAGLAVGCAVKPDWSDDRQSNETSSAEESDEQETDKKAPEVKTEEVKVQRMPYCWPQPGRPCPTYTSP